MPIGSIIEILEAYQRYVDYMNDHGFDDVIESIKENRDSWASLLITMRGHMGETYEMEVYFSETTGELCIDDAITHVSVFDVLDFEEYEITEEVLHYLKYGKEMNTMDLEYTNTKHQQDILFTKIT